MWTSREMQNHNVVRTIRISARISDMRTVLVTTKKDDKAKNLKRMHFKVKSNPRRGINIGIIKKSNGSRKNIRINRNDQ